MFQLPLRVARVARHVLTTGEKSEDMLDADGPQPAGAVLRLHRRSAGPRRTSWPASASSGTLRSCAGFMRDRLLLRSLHEAMSTRWGRRGEEIKALPMADSLVAMVGLREDPVSLAPTRSYRMQAIRTSNMEAGDTEEDLELIAEIDELRSRPAVDQLTTLLVEGLVDEGPAEPGPVVLVYRRDQKPYGLIGWLA